VTLTYTDLVAQAHKHPPGLVQVTREGGHAVVTLNDPDRLNPLSAPLTVALREALEELAADETVRAVVLTGTDPAFSAGGDLRLMRDAAQPMIDEGGGTPEIWRWIRMQFGGIARLITRTDKAFVAAINGPAAGVGLAFGLACDVTLCSDRARLVPAFARIGLLPEVGTSWMLTRQLGYQRTFELFVRGRHITGTEAAGLGIANAVFPHAQLLEAAHDWCRQIEDLPRHVVAMTKPLLRHATDLTWEQAIAMEEFAEPACFTTSAHRDAVAQLLR
jgi:2-(1,2-epoxy-1,2-dihydrophenyl)acetyl-CoA isomerase